MTLSSKLQISAVADYATTLDLAEARSTMTKVYQSILTNGTGAGMADKVFHDQRTLTASSNEDLDLAGVLLDPLGGTLTFARIKGLIVAASANNANNVVVGAAASNAWATLLGATHTLTLRPGAMFAAFAGQADATGWAVTAGTGDLLRVTNSAGVTSVTYDIIIIGSSV
jgi:hypothetical protein